MPKLLNATDLSSDNYTVHRAASLGDKPSVEFKILNRSNVDEFIAAAQENGHYFGGNAREDASLSRVLLLDTPVIRQKEGMDYILFSTMVQKKTAPTMSEGRLATALIAGVLDNSIDHADLFTALTGRSFTSSYSEPGALGFITIEEMDEEASSRAQFR